MKPVGIVSIPLEQVPSPKRHFENLMAAAGNNTGNLLFTNAVWEQIEGPKARIGFTFDPETINKKMRALVIPAANWFGAHVDLGGVADLVERLDIPVVMIGLGVQDDAFSGEVHVPEGTLRLVRAASERSGSISVRGEYSRQILEKYNIRNVTVTGCPSLYPLAETAPADSLLFASEKRTGPVLLHATRYSAIHRPFIDTPSLNREIFRLAFGSRTDLLFQSEPEEISLLVEASNKPNLDEPLRQSLIEIYQADKWVRLENYIRSYGKVFFDIVRWKSAVTKYGGVFGTRLHATIMALNSGTPAILAHHDSRTREMADFAGIPSVAADDCAAEFNSIEDLFAKADFERFVDLRQSNRARYQQFLSDNLLVASVTTKA